MKKNISQIVGGERLSTRSPGDSITNEDIYDTYLHISGAKGAIHRLVKAKWHNGMNEEINIRADKMLVLQDGDVWNNLFGFGIIVLKSRGDSYDVQAWNPMTNGIGFAFTDFNEYGEPTEIEVTYETATADMKAKGIPIQRANPENGQYEGFYPLRTREGLPGPRGVSKILGLMDVLRVQHEVFLEYLRYAKIQGLAHKVLKVKNLSDSKYQKIIGRFRETSKDDLVIVDSEDDFAYQVPQQHAYDPLGLLDFADRFIARDTSLTLFHLTGDPSGYLSGSESMMAGWFADVKQEQDYTLPQYMEILDAFGASEDIQFNDPTETTIEMQMSGVKLFKEALMGIVEPQSIVDAINEYLGLTGSKRLKMLIQQVDPNEEPPDPDADPDAEDEEPEE